METINTNELEKAQGGYYGWPGYYPGYAYARNPYWAFARAEARAEAAYWNSANSYWPLFAAAALANRPQPPTVVYY